MVTNMNTTGARVTDNSHYMEVNVAEPMHLNVTYGNTSVSPDRRKIFNLMQQRQFGGTITSAIAAEKMLSPLKNLTIAAAKISPKRGVESTTPFGKFSKQIPKKILAKHDTQTTILSQVLGSDSTAIFDNSTVEGPRDKETIKDSIPEARQTNEIMH